MPTERLRKLFEAAKRTAKETGCKAGPFQVFIVAWPDGSQNVFPLMWGTDTEKHLKIAILKAMMRETEASAYVAVIQAWMIARERQPGESPDDMRQRFGEEERPSQAPDRMEVIMLMAEEVGSAETLAGHFPITRQPDGTGVVGEWVSWDGAMSSGMMDGALGGRIMN